MRTLRDEFRVPLKDVDRNWLRRGMFAILSIPLLILYLIVGLINGLTEFIETTIEVMK